MLQNYKITPSTVSGVINAPASKSQSIRAILFASLAHGESTIDNYLPSPDIKAMIDACRLLGAEIKVSKQALHIVGVNGKPKPPTDIIDAGNSGLVFRFMTAISALTSGYAVVTGDHSIRHNRPVQPLLDGLTELGVLAISTKNDGYAPIIVKGPLISGKTALDGMDSQPVSALLIALAMVDGHSEVTVHNPGEKPWLALTLAWFDRLGIAYQHDNFNQFVIPERANIKGFSYSVPGDFSSMAFPLVAAIITQSELTINHVDMSDPQGDKQLITILQKMGAHIIIDEPNQRLIVKAGKKLIALTDNIDVNDFIDAVPILAVAACYAQGETCLVGAEIAKHKESNRLLAISSELKKMGADITMTEDGLKIRGKPLSGATVNTHSDHRIIMSLAIAALGATGDSLIQDTALVSKSYPDFLAAMNCIGANIQVST